MNTKLLKNHIGAFAVASALLSVGVVSAARAQGRHGGGGGRSSSSSSGRSNGSSSSRRSNSGSGSSRSGNSSSSRGSGRSDGQGRNNGDSTRVEGRSRDRTRDNNPQSLIRNRVGDRDRNKDRDRDGDTDGDRGRHRRHRERDRDRDDWRRREFDRGRYLYHTRVYQSSNYGNYSYSSNAYERGYEDGLYTAANDARRGESYDPGRSHFYKHGASGFISLFGAPDAYRLAYRDGFLRGYEEGYQHYDVYFTGGRFHR